MLKNRQPNKTCKDKFIKDRLVKYPALGRKNKSLQFMEKVL